jgi:hypothetical protein
MRTTAPQLPLTERPYAVDEVLARMRAALAVKNDAELSSVLGISKSAISSWKKRGKIPLETCLYISQTTMSSIESLLYGGGELKTHDVGDNFVYPILFFLYERCRENIFYGDRWGTCQWWGRAFPHLKQYYESELFSIASVEEITLEEAAERCREVLSKSEPEGMIAFIEKRFFQRR